MIQPAAHSAKTSHAANAGKNAGPAENGGIPAGFAALLALGMPEGAEAEAPEALAEKATAALLRQTTGKTGGKDLPDGLPGEDKIAGEEAQGDSIVGEEDEADAGNSDPDTDAAAIVIPPAAAIVSPSPKAIEAITAASERSRPATSNGQSTQVLTDIVTRFSESQANHSTPVTSGTTALDPEKAGKPNLPDFSGSRRQSPGQTEATGEIPSPPASTNSRNAQATDPVVSVSRPVLAAIQDEEPVKDAARTKEAAPVFEADKSGSHTDNAKPVASRPSRSTPVQQQQHADAASTPDHSEQLTQSDLSLPRAADLQPVIAVREAQSLLHAAPNTPGISAATTSRPEVIDFSTLVDRLVEAREAASPHAVKATVSHTEFGQVSLRFDQQGNGMTVSMNSPDPDFAPAVHAAAANHNANSGDSGSNTPRHDATNQQSANLASGQPHEHAQGSARGHDRERPQDFATGNANSNRTAPEPEQSDGRDGIYA